MVITLSTLIITYAPNANSSWYLIEPVIIATNNVVTILCIYFSFNLSIKYYYIGFVNVVIIYANNFGQKL